MTHPMIRLYGIVPYDRSAKARWLLTELSIPFEDRWLNTEKKENESPEFLRLNPQGRVPVMETEEGAIFESSAILAFLADRHLERGMAPALDSPDRAIYQQWMYFGAATLDAIQARIMIIEDIPAGEVQKKKEADLVEILQDGMEALDRTLSKHSYLVANRLSAADLSVSYHLYWCTLWPELNAVVQKFPKVVDYLARLRQLPSAIKSKTFSYEG
jgi:glutathione S-transferase